MKKFIYILLMALVFSSCSEFQKALKSEDIATKFDIGTKLFEDGKYNKANRLFAQIVPSYRGKPQAEKLMYMYAMSYYNMGDYHLSGYQLERFENTYPKSEKAEEALFLSAKSYYMLSPVYSKEQKYMTEANNLVKELEFKLEKKAFEIAKQYNTTAYYESSDYEAAIKAFDNFLLEYPGTSFREQAMFYRLESAHKLAVNSVAYKKEERLNIALGYFNAFKRYYADSEFIEEAERMNQEIQTELQKINTKS
jgi:outer membrane protein assembly factor BamD